MSIHQVTALREAAPFADSSRVRVVVVSAQLAFAEALGVALESHGFGVVAAVATPEACLRAAEESPDVIVVDLDADTSLPGLLRTVVDHAPFARVVVVTSDASAVACERALRGGAAAFVSKGAPL